MANKKAKSKGKIREKKSLMINNCADTVVIKNRSAIGGGILGVILMVFFIAVTVSMRAAWSSPLFWVVILFLLSSSAYWFASTTFSKIVLDSPKMLMTVYNPFKAEYKFENISYIDRTKSKPKDGYVTHSVNIYIGSGKKRVRIDTLSSAEADEVASLLSGMLESGAMKYPEGNEEPFKLEEKGKKRGGLFASKKQTPKKTDEPAAEDDPISFVTKGTPLPEKKEHHAPESSRDDELDKYNENLIRRTGTKNKL